MNLASLQNVWEFQQAAKNILPKNDFEYLDGASDDQLTYKRNMSIFHQLQIRPRRMVDVSTVDIGMRMFGQNYDSPIVLAPVGLQKQFHIQGERATAKAADRKGTLMIASSLSNASIGEIANNIQGAHKPWFQLYPTSEIAYREKLVKAAQQAGCTALVLTVDVPVLGNRESHGRQLRFSLEHDQDKLGNLFDLPLGASFMDPGLAWRSISWLKVKTRMRILLKGIMTKEDARLAVENGVDGIIVSNHGGRQLDSNLSTMECLEEVIEAVKGRIPVLIDGGFRRGTDIFKALALGAKAVCIGRPYIYGLSVGGEEGVVRVLELLEKELKRNMQLAGVRSLSELNTNYVRWI